MLRVPNKKGVKIFAMSLFCLFAGNSAYAAGAAGCGLGSVIFKENVWWKQVLAATTNNSTGTQTLGITTGTSNCNAKGSLTKVQDQKNYIVVNFSTLQKEAAQGNGTTVEGLASVTGCSAHAYSEFATFLQENYNEIFAVNTPESIVNNLNAKIEENNKLSLQCQTI